MKASSSSSLYGQRKATDSDSSEALKAPATPPTTSGHALYGQRKAAPDTDSKVSKREQAVNPDNAASKKAKPYPAAETSQARKQFLQEPTAQTAKKSARSVKTPWDSKVKTDVAPLQEKRPRAESSSRSVANKPWTNDPNKRPQKPKQPYAKDSGSKAAYLEKKATGLHPNNPHQGRYDMQALVAAVPELEEFLLNNPDGEPTVDFSRSAAVQCLNRALLKHHYGVNHWSLPAGYLCPPIPGRADYVHHLEELLARTPERQRNATVRMLDIGTGTNMIYPILASQALGWHCVATDIDATAIRNAHKLVADNPNLQNIEILLQRNPGRLFSGMIRAQDYFDVTLCNPPFFKSQKEADAQSRRKWRNLKGGASSTHRNFAGQTNELWCEGGELAFLKRMICDSVNVATQVGWFSALVSQQEHVPLLLRSLRDVNAKRVEVVPMAQGQKNSRFIAWHF